MFRRGLLSTVIVMLLAGNPTMASPGSTYLIPQESPPTSTGRSAPDDQKVGALFLGTCLEHFIQGKLTLAEQDCSQAIQENPQEVDAYKLRGYVYLLRHHFDQAAKDFRIALQLRPRDTQIIAGYGQSLSGLGHFSNAASQFRKALSIWPRYAAYWNGLCWALAGEGGRLDRALDSCNRALLFAPGAAGILNSRAIVYLLMQRYPLAVADYDASLKVQPDQASAWFGRGLARLSQGEKNGALDVIEARRRDPGVDGIFVQMKALPANCSQPAKHGCPVGFPPREQAKSGEYQIALLHADPDQELAAGIKASSTDQVSGIKTK